MYITSTVQTVVASSPNHVVRQPNVVVLPKPVRYYSTYASRSSRVLGVIQICLALAVVAANVVIFGATNGYWSTFVAVSHYGCAVQVSLAHIPLDY